MSNCVVILKAVGLARRFHELSSLQGKGFTAAPNGIRTRAWGSIMMPMKMRGFRNTCGVLELRLDARELAALINGEAGVFGSANGLWNRSTIKK